jgi:parallel beta-helix repeat protein
MIYYVDATLGSDLNTGASPSAAWKTISKVNKSTFMPGDLILFKRSEIWREQLNISSSGVAGNPITFSAYGSSGADPIITGADFITTWTENAPIMYSPNLWKATVATDPNLVILNGTKGTRVASAALCDSENKWYWCENALYIYSASNPSTAYTSPGIEVPMRNPIHIDDKSYVTIQNIAAKFGAGWGNLAVLGGSHNVILDGITSTYSSLYGIVIVGDTISSTVNNCTLSYNNSSGLRFENAVIPVGKGNSFQDNFIDHNGGSGISLDNVRGDGNFIIRNTIYSNSGYGIAGNLSTSTASARTVVKSNTVYNNGVYGIVLRTRYWTIENNSIYSNGQIEPVSCGVGTYCASADAEGIGDDNIIRFNIVRNHIKGGGGSSPDGDGILIDQRCDNNQVYYNLSYGNAGAGITVYDGKGTLIYNNVCYGNLQDKTGGFYFAEINIADSGADVTKDTVIKNNIAVATEAEVYAIRIDGMTSANRNTITNNCWKAAAANWYYLGKCGGNDLATWRLLTGEWTDINEAPLFVSAFDFRLLPISSCRSKGVNINLTTDFAGNTVPAWIGKNPDIGAFENIQETPLTVSTKAITSITTTRAECGGDVASDGGVPVIARGVCWSTSSNPTTANSKTTDGAGEGTFASDMNGLVPNTSYHVRSYAISPFGTAYGSDLSFTTPNKATIPTVTTLAVSEIMASGVVSGGNVSLDGGDSITDRGVCWGISANPTFLGSHTSDGTGTGAFTSTLSGLSGGTTYHLRAYAVNSMGTAYGSNVAFRTRGPDKKTVDFNGDGLPDILWRNSLSGEKTWSGFWGRMPSLLPAPWLWA